MNLIKVLLLCVPILVSLVHHTQSKKTILCKAPVHVKHGIKTSNRRIYRKGQKLVYRCRAGYEKGSKTAPHCTETGNWSHQDLVCKPRACPDPGNPENGYRLGSNYHVGKTVRFTCDLGFKTRGSRSRTCLKNKTWSGKLTICDNGRSDCPVLGTPVSGYKIGNRYNFGSIVRFQCKRGYILKGSSHRLCTNKGTWNGTEPKCVDIFEHLVTDVNQTAIILRKGLDSMLEYTCSGGNKTCNTSGLDSRAKKVSVDLSDSRGLDVLFVFDASSSIDDKDFRLGVKFAMRLVHVLKPTWKPKGTRVAAIVYATHAEVVFNFREHSAYSISGVRSMLRKIIKVRTGRMSSERIPKRLKKDGILKGGTASALALEMAASKIFLTRRSKRKRVLFFITDGMSNIGGPPKRNAEILKMKPGNGGFNVDIYAIGVGEKVADRSNNMYKELYDIASEREEHVIIVKSYNDLAKASQKAIEIKYDYSPCGEGSSFYSNRGKIAGGNKVAKGKWPWQVGIYRLSQIDDNLILQCGGALIEPGWVLTAAHCLYDKKNRRIHGLIVVAGDNVLAHDAFDENAKSSQAEDYFEPDNYKHGNSFKNDIALIKLQKPFTLGPFVRKICLPTKRNLTKPGEYGYVAGWGKIKPYKEGGMAVQFDNSKVLLESRFEIQPNKICINSTSKSHRHDFDPDVVFCAGDGKGGNDTCHGDSGGSFTRLVKQNETYKWVSVGLVSWGEGCGMPDKYGMYTKVGPFINWIKNTIRDNTDEI